SNSKGAEFKVAFPSNYVVYAFSISLSCSYTGNAQGEKFPVMVDVAQRRRLGALLRACCLFISPSKSRE
ncbi:hypothetical protein Tco_0022723, partial [Tanacetum coccineum]